MAWGYMKKRCEEMVVYEVRWLGLKRHGGGVSMVLWRRMFLAYGLVLIGFLGRIVQHHITRRSERMLKDLKCVPGMVGIT
jgi:hypothetical protein